MSLSKSFAFNLHWSLIRTSAFEARALLGHDTASLPFAVKAMELLEATDRDSRLLNKV